MIIAIDTNVLVLLLVRDNKAVHRSAATGDQAPGKRRRLGMTVPRKSSSSLSSANAASACVRKASIASSLSRKLAVSSTRTSGSATLARSPGGLQCSLAADRSRGGAPRLQCGDGGIGVARASGGDVRQPRHASSINSRWMRLRSSRW